MSFIARLGAGAILGNWFKESAMLGTPAFMDEDQGKDEDEDAKSAMTN